MEHPGSTGHRHQLVPAALTAASAVAALVLATFGSGAFGGTAVQDAAGGYLSATATPVSPAAPAFSIWSVVYAGILGYAVWQLFPAARGSGRQRAVRPWAAASMLLNAGWLWAAQVAEPSLALPATMGVMLVLLAVLCRLFALHLSMPAASRAERILSDGTFGLYLGWICVATVANAAALLGFLLGARPGDASPSLPAGLAAGTAAIVVLAVAAGIGVALAATRRWAPLLAMAWGLGWIATARLAGPLTMPEVGLAAAAAAAVVLASGLTVRLRSGRRSPLRRGSREAHA
ncbi:tryptophan-rich sensory protein [Sinomonas cellulolyticus]|uniref:Tryptophan-rich sensory protein n=1 Tax=Sinomonas cellulolyticus TaxID=2801916 RepID=A0ABS1K6B8_9MICC|nr:MULTISPECIES: tryptophan-rich sensory protein [Sinomonas]MBL0707035.1 tryptophan-rich sensory protein [Sinomonas cellulolyticus]GHG54307.1 tryptophan-rich sensory protein [Sinomonas sp. KCTC 49339]